MNNSLKTQATLESHGKPFAYYSLPALAQQGLPDPARLPFSIRILLENLLRNEDGIKVKREDIEALACWEPKRKAHKEIAFTPARVILQDFTGVPAVVDLAAMRDQMVKMGGDPKKINPLERVDLVIDHSVQVDEAGTPEAFSHNVQKEMERNRERYQFLRWGQTAFENFRVVPPGTGIIHQVNLEYLASGVMTKDGVVFPDTLVGTDSHTTMINGLGVLGWGVGGIEAEAAMLGQPISMLIPEVIGLRLKGKLPAGATATDLVLMVTEMLRKKGVVGKFVEFFGPGLDDLPLADRATLSNMAPEYGATCGIFPVDHQTLEFMKLTARPKETVELAEIYFKAQGLFRTSSSPDPEFTDVLELDMSKVVPSLAGPKRPQDRVALSYARQSFRDTLSAMGKEAPAAEQGIGHGAVVIAAITSCTNTSNPAVMIGAGILAKKAVEKGLEVKPWVKPSLSPGSKVVMDYLARTGLQPFLEKLKFHLTGFGCMTCIGNSGPLEEPVASAIKKNEIVAAAVLSGNRNFEGRINPLVRANYLASPALVVAYALAGTVDIDLTCQPVGRSRQGKDVFLRDLWPDPKEVQAAVNELNADMFRSRYADVFKGEEAWNALPVPSGATFAWDETSTYVKHPPYFEGMAAAPEPLKDIDQARVLVMVGDSVTTDHISPAGAIPADGPAGKYLIEHGVEPKDFNSFGSRRGNHEVMARGTFANIRLKNLLAPGTEGGWTVSFPRAGKTPIYDAAMQYQKEGVALIVLAGAEYGTGSSRDWAAKGPALLGIKAVIAKSFERIHRSNLIGMGILPLQFLEGETRESLGLTGQEIYSLSGIAHGLEPGKILSCKARSGEKEKTFRTVCRIDTPVELDYYRHGGILRYVLRHLLR